MRFNKIIPFTHNLKREGFTLIQTMIAMLCVSALVLGVTNYLKKNQQHLQESDVSNDPRASSSTVKKRLVDDIRQTVYLNPSCDQNHDSTVNVTTLCSNLVFQGGVTPFPGSLKSDMDALTNFAIPANLTASSSSLSHPSDAIRLVQFDFSGAFNCRLYDNHNGANPSTTSGNGAGAERFWARQAECGSGAGQLYVGKLYILVQWFGTAPNYHAYSNLFQITALTPNTPDSNQLQVDLASSSNLYNQPGGMGLSGFTTEARIFPVKLVEWAADGAGNLYRREIKPSQTDMTGKQAWQLVEDDVEGVQFYPLTITSTGPYEDQRTMVFNSGDPLNNGLWSIKGVSPRVVIKSRKPNFATTYTDPLVASSVPDNYPRQDMKFFIDMRNVN